MNVTSSVPEAMKTDIIKVVAYLTSEFASSDNDGLKADRRAIAKRMVDRFTVALGYYDALKGSDNFIAVVADDEKEETVLVAFWQPDPPQFSVHEMSPRFHEFVNCLPQLGS